MALLGLALPLFGQMPGPWVVNKPLGEDITADGQWFGMGTWAADSHGKLGTLVNSLGMGNSLQGVGIHLETGFRRKDWDMAIEGMAIRNPQGESYLTIYRGHLTHTGSSGWITSLEQEPLVWGYGLNGGYLLGEAARPFPRLRLESPMTHLQWGNIHFGTWGFQVFMGRLEKNRVLSDSIQDPASRKTILQDDPSAPLFNGYRLQAVFADVMEFYMNYTNLWGGTLRGKGMTEGYGFSDYFTAMFGLKDTLAESSVNYNDPNHPIAEIRSNAKSSSNMDLGARLRFRGLEQAMGAKAVHAYISRGSKNETWPISVFIRRPFYYIGKDIEKDMGAIAKSQVGVFWNEKQHVSVPTLAAPNDTVGLLIAWPNIRLGMEYSDTVNVPNGPNSSIRSFVSGNYPAGFYYHGDPLGNALGGEAQTTSIRLDVDSGQKVSTGTLVHVGHRPFRDNLIDWQADYPDSIPAKNRFFGLQQTFKWKFNPTTTATLAASWERQSAVDYIKGREGNTFRWYVDLRHRWTYKQ